MFEALMNWEWLQDYWKVIETAVLVGIMLALRHVVIRTILRNAPKGEVRRRWVVSIRNLTFVAILVIVLAIWSDAIQGYATALLAVAVATVIATKELILCLLGSFLRTVSDAYAIGHRIEIGPHRGDVIDITPLTTTLLEVGPGSASHLRTGRTVVIPNALLTAMAVVNESHMRQFVVHYFNVPLAAGADWKRAERVLLEGADAECRSFMKEARHHMADIERQHGLSGLPLQPRVFVEPTDVGNVRLMVRVPTPVGSQGKIEQAILRRYLAEFPPAAPGAPLASGKPAG